MFVVYKLVVVATTKERKSLLVLAPSLDLFEYEQREKFDETRSLVLDESQDMEVSAK